MAARSARRAAHSLRVPSYGQSISPNDPERGRCALRSATSRQLGEAFPLSLPVCSRHYGFTPRCSTDSAQNSSALAHLAFLFFILVFVLFILVIEVFLIVEISEVFAVQSVKTIVVTIFIR